MRRIILVLILVSWILSSCVEIDSKMFVDNNLSVSWKTTIDYTILNSMSEWFSDYWTWITMNTENQTEKKTPCDTFESSSSWFTVWSYEKETCINIDENIAEIIWEWGSFKEFISYVDWNYVLNLKKVTESNSNEEEKSEEEQIQSINMLKSMWFEMNYIIELPSNIIEANIWEYVGNKIIFDIFDIVYVENPHVIFEDNWKIIEVNNLDINNLNKIKEVLLIKIMILKSKLQNTKRENYLKKFDYIIPKLSSDKFKKLSETLRKIDLNNTKIKEYKDILTYLKILVELEKINKKNINNEIININDDNNFDFKIIKESSYVPTNVKFSFSWDKIEWKDIEKIILYYWNGKNDEVKENINEYTYIDYWDYNINVKVIDINWKEYFFSKLLILKPKPQTVKIKTSLIKAPIWQEIEFIPEVSWEVNSYFWDFWDWKTSTDISPIHFYSNSWKYKVKMSVDFSNKNILQDEIEIDVY